MTASMIANILLALVGDLLILAGLVVFTRWESKRRHACEAVYDAAVQAAKQRPVTDEVDDFYRTAIASLWGPQPQPIGIHPHDRSNGC